MALFGSNPPVSRLEELKRILVKDPTSRQFLALAEEYRKQGKLRDAVVTLERGLQTHTTSVAAHVALGKTYQQLDRPEDAIRSYQNALKIDRENLVAIRHLAEVYLAKGDRIEAIKKLKLYSGLKPGDKEVGEHIARLEGEIAAHMAAARERAASRPPGKPRPPDLYSEMGLHRPQAVPGVLGSPRPRSELGHEVRPPAQRLFEPEEPAALPAPERLHEEPLWEAFAALEAATAVPPAAGAPAARTDQPTETPRPVEMTYDGSLLAAAAAAASAAFPPSPPPPQLPPQPKISPMEMTYEGSFLKTVRPEPPAAAVPQSPEDIRDTEEPTKIIHIEPLQTPRPAPRARAEISTVPLKESGETLVEPPPFADAEAFAVPQPEADLFEPSLEPPGRRKASSEIPILSTPFFEESALTAEEPAVAVEEEITEVAAPRVEAPPSPPARPPIVSETLGDLYRAQGHVEEARDTYRTLAAAVPDEERSKELLSKAEELRAETSGIVRLRAFAARFPERPGVAPSDLKGVLQSLVSKSIGIRAAALTDRQGLPVVAAGEAGGDGAAVEALVAEMASFLAAVERTRGEVGEGALDVLTLVSEKGGAMVSRVTSDYALVLRVDRGASLGEVRYEAARAARALRPAVVG